MAIDITHEELLDLINNDELIPSSSYRITNYTTTTVQADTTSAGHDFDILPITDPSQLPAEMVVVLIGKSNKYVRISCSVLVKVIGGNIVSNASGVDLIFL